MLQSIRPSSDELKGGTLCIPDGYAIIQMDLDADTPICTICKGIDVNNTQTLEIPRALAYYLTTHHNGSWKFRERLRIAAQNDLRGHFRDLLAHKDIK